MATIHVTDATLKGQLTGNDYTGPVEEGATFTGDVIYQDAPVPPDPNPVPPSDSFWTEFTATEPSGEGSSFTGAGTRKIYVAANGNDGNPGTEAKPKKTVAAGVSLLRQNKPDWLLFRKGDVWTQQRLEVDSSKNVLIGAYGSGARPLLQCVPDNDQWGTAVRFSGDCSNTCVVGLDFYAHTRDPNHPDFIARSTAGENSNLTGFSLQGSGSNFTLEDCAFRFHRHGFDCIGTYETVRLRRCVVLDTYDYKQPGSGNVEGVFFSYCTNAVLEECILDGNGHCDQLGHTPITLSHGGYIRQPNNQGNGVKGPGVMIGCWSSRNAADGMQLRTGGTIKNNLYTLNADGFECGHDHEDGEGGAMSSSATVTGNVVIRSQNVGAGRAGHGFTLASCQTDGVQVHDNVVCHLHENARHTGGGSGAVWAQPIFLEKCTGVVVTDNVIYDWPTDDNQGVLASKGGSNTTSPNATDLAGANTEGYSDPKRTVASYYKSIGGTEDEIAFINAVRKQSKDHWDDKLTARAVVNYIRAGFDLSPV